MVNAHDLLIEIRDVGIRDVPERDDAGDRRVRAQIQAALADKGPNDRRQEQHRRVFRFRNKDVVPVLSVMIGLGLTTVAAAAVVLVSASTVFRTNPLLDRSRINRAQPNYTRRLGAFNPTTVRLEAQTSIPDFGRVQYWGASTKGGGACFALKLPDGQWAGYPKYLASERRYYEGGDAPGCFLTYQQQVLSHGGPVVPLESWQVDIKNRRGVFWTVFFGYVEALGQASAVWDALTGRSAQVTTAGYYILAERTPTAQRDGVAPKGAAAFCFGCDVGDLRVLNQDGAALKADYQAGRMVSGHKPGPTPGSNTKLLHPYTGPASHAPTTSQQTSSGAA